MLILNYNETGTYFLCFSYSLTFGITTFAHSNSVVRIFILWYYFSQLAVCLSSDFLQRRTLSSYFELAYKKKN